MDTFVEFVGEMRRIRESKRQDYAGGGQENWAGNFVLQALLGGKSVRDSFRSLQWTKVARLVNLDQQEQEPNNESVADTHLDLANYTALLQAFVDEWGMEATNKPLYWHEAMRYVMAYTVGYPIPGWEELRDGDFANEAIADNLRTRLEETAKRLGELQENYDQACTQVEALMQRRTLLNLKVERLERTIKAQADTIHDLMEGG